MPILGFTCPGDDLDYDGFDHFENCEHGPRGRPAFSPWLARQIARGFIEDVRHSGLRLTTTRTMACARATYLQARTSCYVNPRDVEVMARGTAGHAAAAQQWDPAHWISEATDRVRLNVKGRLFKSLVHRLGIDPPGTPTDGLVTEDGVYLDGLIDALHRPPRWEIVDLKFPKDWSISYRNKTGAAKTEHAIQLNIARLLLAQQQWAKGQGYNPETTRMTIWDHAIGRAEGCAPQAADPMTEEQILRVRPGTTYKMVAERTVADLICDHVTTARLDQNENCKYAPVLAACIPAAGLTQFNGACENRCPVRAECKRLMREYGRPEVIAANPFLLSSNTGEET